MKTCRICKLDYSDSIDVCPTCGSKLEKKEDEWINPGDYEGTY